MIGPYITVTIVAAWGSWTTGIARRQPAGNWHCRRLADPVYLLVEETIVDTERQAVRWLRANRWCLKLRKVRMPQTGPTDTECPKAASSS